MWWASTLYARICNCNFSTGDYDASSAGLVVRTQSILLGRGYNILYWISFDKVIKLVCSFCYRDYVFVSQDPKDQLLLGQVHTHTHTHTQTQANFLACFVSICSHTPYTFFWLSYCNTHVLTNFVTIYFSFMLCPSRQFMHYVAICSSTGLPMPHPSSLTGSDYNSPILISLSTTKHLLWVCVRLNTHTHIHTHRWL